MATGIPAIVLHWNNPEGALRSARSLALYAPECAVIIVDNGSPEAALNELEERAAQEGFRVVRTGKNTGFAGGMNYAVMGSDLCEGATYALLSCHGVEVTAGCVAKIIQAFESDPKAGMLAAQVRDGEPVEYYGPDPRWRERPPAPYVETVWVTGAQVIVRVAAYRAMGGFDERFFAYYEDVDLSVRLGAAGYRVGIVTDAELLESGSTLPHVGRIYLIARNRILSVGRREGGRAKTVRAVRTAVESASAFIGSVAPWRKPDRRRQSRLFARGQFYAAIDGMAGVVGPGRAFELQKR